MYRNREIGYVWQFHYLLPEFTALENVACRCWRGVIIRKAALAEAARWLERVGLGDRGEHRSGELSGGEQQRLSIARALITRPKLLLADEPTGDLDNVTAEQVFALLQELHRENGLASVLVTHNLEFAARCDTGVAVEGWKIGGGVAEESGAEAPSLKRINFRGLKAPAPSGFWARFPTEKSRRGFRRAGWGFGFPARGRYTRVNSLDAGRQSVLSAAEQRGGGQRNVIRRPRPRFSIYFPQARG